MRRRAEQANAERVAKRGGCGTNSVAAVVAEATMGRTEVHASVVGSTRRTTASQAKVASRAFELLGRLVDHAAVVIVPIERRGVDGEG